jgi:hypothetical protein
MQCSARSMPRRALHAMPAQRLRAWPRSIQAFRPGMKALQASGDVVVTGSSYNELGVGFT